MRSDEFCENFEDVSSESVALTWTNLARRVGLKYVWGQYIFISIYFGKEWVNSRGTDVMLMRHHL